MNWKTLHHLYVGCGIGGLGIAWLFIALPLHSLPSITYALLMTIGGFAYAVDDAFQHWKGWNTPFHRLDVLLKKMGWWKKLCDWLEKKFFKKEVKDA